LKCGDTIYSMPPSPTKGRTGTQGAHDGGNVNDTARFADFEASVSDAWTVDEDVINPTAARITADSVLKEHARWSFHLRSGAHFNSRHNRAQALQRLATQKDPLPASANCVTVPLQQQTPSSLYPKLPEFNSQDLAFSSGGGGRAKDLDALLNEAEEGRFKRLQTILQGPRVNLDELRNECWKGVPQKLRPLAWRLLAGLVPTNLDERQAALKAKRDEYFKLVENFFHTRHEAQFSDTFRQIHIDIPRMCPLIPLFQQKIVQEIFERILYIWAIRHPSSGYVQGINDLVTPFFVVFLSEFVISGEDVGCFNVGALPREVRDAVEADSFWCVSALLETILDNYTFAQPGIQYKVKLLETLVTRVDNALHAHLKKQEVEYLQFAFRWMNNILMREVPLRATIRLWDTYLSEPNGFAEFHVYVCAAFLRMWSRQLRAQKDFQNVMLLVQNLPTQHWGDQQIKELAADAYSLMVLFAGAKNHLQPSTT